MPISTKNLNFRYIRGITPKRETGGGVQLCGLAPGKQLRRNVAATVSCYQQSSI